MISQHVSDLTAATAQIDALKQRLEVALTALKEWQIEFRFNVDPNAQFVEVVAQKPNGGKGAIKKITRDQLEYYHDDVTSLAAQVAADFADFLLRDTIRQALLEAGFDKAVKNALTIGKYK